MKNRAVRNFWSLSRLLVGRRAFWLTLGEILLVGACVAGIPAPAPVPGQPAQYSQFERAIEARARLFPDAGSGVRALKRDAAGHYYYILTAPGAAVGVYSPDGKRVGQIPENQTKETAIRYGEDLEVDSGGQIYVADRGANAIKVFDPKGRLTLTIPVPAPTSLALLPGGEIAVASMRTSRLVEVFDGRGKVVREFGDPSELAEHAELNRFLNIGRLDTDAAGHIYYAFSYLPEPSLRKYDRYGYAKFDLTVTSLEFQAQAQAVRREIFSQDRRAGVPNFKRVIDAVGVDPQTEVVFVAIGDELLEFDRDGNRKATYRTFTAEGERVEPVSILVEPDRMLLATDSFGIFDFPRPDKPAPAPSPSKPTPQK